MTTQPNSNDSGGDYWGKVSQEKQEAALSARDRKPEPGARRPLGRRLLRAALWAGLALIIVVGVVGIFLPQIASGLAPRIVAGQSGSAVAGRLSVDAVALSWGGPQRVEGFKLASADGTQIVTGTVETTASLMGLIRGGLDLGEINLSKLRADIVRDEQGVTNIQRAIAKPGAVLPAKGPAQPEAAPAPGGIKLPEGLRARVRIREVTATFVDRSGMKPGAVPAIVTLSNVEGNAGLEPGKPLSIELSAMAQTQTSPQLKPSSVGSIRVRATADNWSKADGTLTPNLATVQANAEIKDLPLALLDTLLAPMMVGANGKPMLATPDGAAVKLAEALGERLNLDLVANGSMRDGTATINLNTPNATLGGELRVAGAIVTAEKPVELFVKGVALKAFVPALAAAMDPAQATHIAAAPDARVRIETLNLAIPGEGAMNLAGTKVSAVVGLSQMTGSVTLGEGQAPKPFTIAPLEARLTTDDLAKEARFSAATVATIDGQPAGSLDVSAIVQGLLDAKGAPVKGLPSSIQANAKIAGMATAIAQPFVQAMGLDLASDIGPTLDAEVAIASDAAATSTPGAQPPLNATFMVNSQFVRAAGTARVTSEAITTTAGGITIDMDRAVGMGARFVKPETGWTIAAAPGKGRVNITAKNITIPRTKEGAADLANMLGSIRVMTQGLIATPTTGTAAGRPIQVGDLGADVNIAAGGTPDAQLKGAMSWEGTPFTFSASGRVPGLVGRVMNPPMIAGSTPPTAQPLDAPALLAMRPVVTVTMTDVPTALVRALMPPPADATQADIPALTEAGLGERIKTLLLEIKNGEGDRTALNLSMDASRLIARVAGDFTTKDVSLPRTAVSFEAAPDLIDRILRQYAPDIAAKGWGVARPAWMNLEVMGTKVPLDSGFKPNLLAASPVKVRLTTSSPLILRGVAVDDGQGGMRSLGELGVDGLEIDADVPIGALLGPALPEERSLSTRIKTSFVGNNGQQIGTMNLTAKGDISEGGPVGPLSATLGLDKLDMATIERFMGRNDGILSGFVGNGAGADITLVANPGTGPKPDFASAPMDVSAALRAPRMRTDKPIKLSITPDRIRLSEATTITMDVDPAAANRFLLSAEQNKDVAAVTGPGVGNAKGVASLTLSQPTTVTLDLKRLSIPRSQLGQAAGAGAAAPGPKRPVDLDIDTSITIPGASMMTAENVPVVLTGVVASVTSEQVMKGRPVEGAPINFRLGVAQGQYAQDPPAKDMSLTGRVTNLFDSTGAVNARLATLDVEGDMPVVPTGLVDAFLQRDGLLLDALGPSMAMRLRCERVPLAPPEGGGPSTANIPADALPVVDFRFNSQRATVTMRGNLRDGKYISTDPLVVKVSEVTQQLSARFIKGLPLVGSLEKKPEDMPATLRADGMIVPLGSTMDGLNMRVSLDPGEARFATSGVFNDLLKAISSRTEGQVGKRLDPLEVIVKDGIASYKTWRVPVGQFTFETEGFVNLSTRSVTQATPYGDIRLEPQHIDVITWIPFGALSDRALGQLNLGIGGALNKFTPGAVDALTKIPFRTRGPSNNPSTQPDAELIAKNLVNQIKPEKVIDNILGNILKPKPAEPAAPK